jgi:plastocyanin
MRKLILLALAVVAVTAVAPAAAKTVTVTITKNGYVPSSITIAPGDAVTFANADTSAHQVVFKQTTGVTCTPNPLVLQPGQSGTCTFRTAGTYTYSDPNAKGSTFKGTVVVSGKPGGGGSVTLQASRTVVTYGGSVTLSGTVSNGKAGETVVVVAEPCGQTAFSQVATATTTTGGNYSYVVKPLLNTTYQAKLRGSTSSSVLVKVRPRIRLGHPAANRYSVRVSASTSFAGKVVAFQRYSSSLSRWVTVKRVTLRASTAGVAPTVVSAATFRARVAHHLRLRISMPQAQAGSCYLAARSNVILS